MILEEDFKKKDEPKKKEFRFLGSNGLQTASFLGTYCNYVVIFFKANISKVIRQKNNKKETFTEQKSVFSP